MKKIENHCGCKEKENIFIGKNKKYKNSRILKNEIGITLVALIVTIIILMILVGVVVATITGNNGILSKSKFARDTYQNSINEENGQISSYENEIDVASSRNEIASNLIEYKGIECRLTEKNEIKYFKNEKEIWPIYWYGLEPIKSMYSNNIFYWNETNNVPKIIKNEDSFTYSAYMRITYRQCIGGLATGLPIDLTNYKECHMIIKSSNVTTQMQVINRAGYCGSYLRIRKYECNIKYS